MTEGLKTEEELGGKFTGGGAGGGGKLGMLLIGIFILPVVITFIAFAALIGGSAVLCAWLLYAVYQRIRHGRSLRAVAANSALAEADQVNNPFAGMQR